MIINKFKGIVVFGALLIFVSPVFSQTAFEPAKFREADNIIDKIAFPKKGGDINLIIPCTILLPLSGRISNVFCYLKNPRKHDWLFERAIYQALSNARMDRAMVDGNAKSVRLNFIVAFIRNQDEESIEIHLNHATDFEKYGVKYSEPQRVIPLDRNFSLHECRADINIWVKTLVDVNGRSAKTGLLGGKVAKKCKESILKQYDEILFIPAHAKGVPVEAVLYEQITRYFAGEGRLKDKRIYKGAY